MILSMTGYGKSEFELSNEKFSIEIRSLNSKNADVFCKIPFSFRVEEIKIRKLIKDKLQRGKIDFSIYKDNDNSESSKTINSEIVFNYINKIKELEIETGTKVNALEIALKYPEILTTKVPEFKETDIDNLYTSIEEAIINITKFRTDEGAGINTDILDKINNIINLMPEIEKFEAIRNSAVREKLVNSFKDLNKEIELDSNRFEQEIIYYLEKLDINEEKQRLNNHCNYFIETVESSTTMKGKKLSFISQEIGREINTLGSKSNNAEMQKIVVQMKDELEQIKEQVLNVL